MICVNLGDIDGSDKGEVSEALSVNLIVSQSMAI